eukprot:scaffold14956_cov109-Isochrysis_galbana.AAC.1
MMPTFLALAARQPADGRALLALLKAAKTGDLFALQDRKDAAKDDSWVNMIIARGTGSSWTEYNESGDPRPDECVLDETDVDNSMESEFNVYYRAPEGLGHAAGHLLPLAVPDHHVGGDDNTMDNKKKSLEESATH